MMSKYSFSLHESSGLFYYYDEENHAWVISDSASYKESTQFPWSAAKYMLAEAILETQKRLIKSLSPLDVQAFMDETGIVNNNKNYQSVYNTLTALYDDITDKSFGKVAHCYPISVIHKRGRGRQIDFIDFLKKRGKLCKG